ncbi:30S ribosomal protein S6--L-glutamate ligase, partial [Salmonella enterica]
FYGTAALRQFELLGSYPLNESVAITRARDKLRSLQLLARQGIDRPITGIAHSPDDTSDLIKMVGGAPLVVKLVEGTQGIGVVLAETR